MSAPASKQKRRIQPVAVTPAAPAPSPASALPASSPRSVYFDSFLQHAANPDYAREVEERAAQLGYEELSAGRKGAPPPAESQPAAKKKQRAPRKPKEPRTPVDHGPHIEFLNDFDEYALQWLRLKRYSKEQTLYEWLKGKFDKSQFYSTKSRRFRRPE